MKLLILLVQFCIILEIIHCFKHDHSHNHKHKEHKKRKAINLRISPIKRKTDDYSYEDYDPDLGNSLEDYQLPQLRALMNDVPYDKPVLRARKNAKHSRHHKISKKDKDLYNEYDYIETKHHPKSKIDYYYNNYDNEEDGAAPQYYEYPEFEPPIYDIDNNDNIYDYALDQMKLSVKPSDYAKKRLADIESAKARGGELEPNVLRARQSTLYEGLHKEGTLEFGDCANNEPTEIPGVRRNIPPNQNMNYRNVESPVRADPTGIFVNNKRDQNIDTRSTSQLRTSGTPQLRQNIPPTQNMNFRNAFVESPVRADPTGIYVSNKRDQNIDARSTSPLQTSGTPQLRQNTPPTQNINVRNGLLENPVRTDATGIFVNNQTDQNINPRSTSPIQTSGTPQLRQNTLPTQNIIVRNTPLESHVRTDATGIFVNNQTDQNINPRSNSPLQTSETPQLRQNPIESDQTTNPLIDLRTSPLQSTVSNDEADTTSTSPSQTSEPPQLRQNTPPTLTPRELEVTDTTYPSSVLRASPLQNDATEDPTTPHTRESFQNLAEDKPATRQDANAGGKLKKRSFFDIMRTLAPLISALNGDKEDSDPLLGLRQTELGNSSNESDSVMLDDDPEVKVRKSKNVDDFRRKRHGGVKRKQPNEQHDRKHDDE